MKKKLIFVLFSLVLISGWQGCVSRPQSTAALDALIEELAAAPAWSDLTPSSIESEGKKLVAFATKTKTLSIKELRYVEFNYLARYEDAHLKIVTVGSGDGTGYQQPFARITVPAELRHDYRRAWSKLHVVNRIYFAVPEIYFYSKGDRLPEAPRTEKEWQNSLYPLERVDGELRLVKPLKNEVLASDPRAEFAYLAYTYGSRVTGEKVRYDYW